MAKGKRQKSLSAELYAVFRDDTAFSIRDMKSFIRNGGKLSNEEITAILDKLYINFAFELEAENIEEDRVIRYLDLAEAYLEAAQIKFIEIPLYADVIEGASDVDGEIDIAEGQITIDGIDYAIVSSNDFFTLKRAGIHRRGRTITSFSELAEYVNAIPAVFGIEIVYNVSGTITGYRVWVSDRTDGVSKR